MIVISTLNTVESADGVAYYQANIFRQFELVDLFEPIINNVMQGFLICFINILDEKKKNKLIELTTQMSFK